jgi:hypothetical protein
MLPVIGCNIYHELCYVVVILSFLSRNVLNELVLILFYENHKKNQKNQVHQNMATNEQFYEIGDIIPGNGYCKTIKLESTKSIVVNCLMCLRMGGDYEHHRGICDVYCKKRILNPGTTVCVQWVPHSVRFKDKRMKKKIPQIQEERIRVLANKVAEAQFGKNAE